MISNIECFPINELWYYPWWLSKPFLASLIGGCVLAMLLGLFFLVRWVRSRRPARAIWLVACDELDALCMRKGDTASEVVQTYAELTQIVKKYCSTRYAYDFASSTDDEFLGLVVSQVPPQAYQTLHRVFRAAQTIKFAHENVLAERIVHDIAQAKEIINATVPPEIASREAVR